MSTPDEHTRTTQETVLYDAMSDGDWDTVEQLRADAYTADPTPPEEPDEEWLAPAQQYDADYQDAWNHYQADHEMPQEEREANTKDKTTKDNKEAKDKEKPPKLPKEVGEDG